MYSCLARDHCSSLCFDICQCGTTGDFQGDVVTFPAVFSDPVWCVKHSETFTADVKSLLLWKLTSWLLTKWRVTVCLCEFKFYLQWRPDLMESHRVQNAIVSSSVWMNDLIAPSAQWVSARLTLKHKIPVRHRGADLHRDTYVHLDLDSVICDCNLLLCSSRNSLTTEWQHPSSTHCHNRAADTHTIPLIQNQLNLISHVKLSSHRQYVVFCWSTNC